jgi:hypothetical protein
MGWVGRGARRGRFVDAVRLRVTISESLAERTQLVIAEDRPTNCVRAGRWIQQNRP